MRQTGFHLISLGCAKNTVDSESMAALLEREGYVSVAHREEAEVLVVNTCGFIQPAREESLRKLIELAQDKRPDQLLIAAGCMTQRLGLEVAQQVQGLDGILGTRRWMDIVTLLRKLRVRPDLQPVYHLPAVENVGRDEKGVLRAAVQGASAYLKIADGCRRPCSFCAIPLIKGTHLSRPKATILEEARRLQDQGVRELILISQDTTDYGHDLGMRDGLSALLQELVEVAPQIDWIRLLYAYPGQVTERLIEMMADRNQILPYLDMPLQHAHPDILHKMRRPANIDWVYRTIEKMRSQVPDLVLRSTFIVGFPGETEIEFRALEDFVREMRFDRVGVFTYFAEEGTASAALKYRIAPELKDQRRRRLMAIQQQISLEKNQQLVGTKLDVLVEGYGNGLSIGRSFRDAPEIDGLVFVEGKAAIGSLASTRVTGAMPYDLTAELLSEQHAPVPVDADEGG